jgi:hypothetical protein
MHKTLTLGMVVLAGGFLAAGVVPTSAQERPASRTASQDLPKRDRMALAGELFELTHTRLAVNQWGQMIRAADISSACNCGGPQDLGKQTAVWENAVDRLFDGKGIYDKLQLAAATKFTDAELAKMLAFNTSALGRKVNAAMKPPTELNRDAAAEATMLRVAEQQLRANPARRAVMIEIVDAVGAVKFVASSVLNIAAGATIGMASAQPAGRPRPDEELILQTIEGIRPTTERAMASIMPAAYQNLLKSLSLQELKAYRDELRTPMAMALRDEGMAVMDREIRSQTMDIGRSVAKELASTRL